MSKGYIAVIIAFCIIGVLCFSSCLSREIEGKDDYYEWLNSQQATETTVTEVTEPSDNNQNETEENEPIEMVQGVPSYWIDSLNVGVSKINQVLSNIGVDKSSFLFYSDVHWNNGAQVSPLLLSYLYRNTGINKTVFGGDIVSDVTDTQYLWTWRSMLKDISNHHSVVGDYDGGVDADNPFTETYVYSYLLAPEESPDVVRESNGLYYYIDYSVENTRYLYLDIAYIGVNAAQKNFIINALKTTPENWHIVVIAHRWYDLDSESSHVLGEDILSVLEIFDNYNARAGQFNGCGGKVEFCIGGHTHMDYDGKSDGGIPIILVETDSRDVRNGKDESEYQYVKRTDTEAYVNGIIADYNNGKIYVIRVGRGESREVDLPGSEIKDNNLFNKAYASDGKRIYAYIGYRLRTQWDDKDQIEIFADKSYLTGWIPVSVGDVINLENIVMNRDADNTKVFFTSVIGLTEATYDANALTEHCNAVWDESGNLRSFTVPNAQYYMRIQCEEITTDSLISLAE